MSTFAPIAVFAFNRPDHLARLLESLETNSELAESHVFLFCDGPRGPEDTPQISRVHEVVDLFAARHSSTVIKREQNMGLAPSILAGVSQILEVFDRFIVLEDDLVLAPAFLRFMNEALDAFQDKSEIGCITGYMYPVPLAEPQSILLPFVTSWGWATWADRWRSYNPDGRALAREISGRGLRRAFDLDGAFQCWEMLQDQIEGWSSSWWIRWYATLFLQGKLSVWPGIPLLLNKGLDGSGVHCGPTNGFDGRLASEQIRILSDERSISIDYWNAIRMTLSKNRRSSFLLALRRRLPRSFFVKVIRPLVHARGRR